MTSFEFECLQVMTTCFAGAVCVHHMCGCGAPDLCFAAHSKTQHDGLQGGWSVGKPAGTVFPAQSLLLNGDI